MYIYKDGIRQDESGGVVPAGSISSSEIATGAVTDTKLATDSVTTAKILNANVTDAKLASSFDKVLAVSTTQTEVVNDSTEQTVYTLSVPGGTLSTGNIIRVLVRTSYLNNTGSNQNISFRFKYGSSMVTLATVSTIGPTATRREGTAEFWLIANNSANAQIGSLVATTGNSANNRATGTENSANTLNLVLTVQHSAAASTLSVIISGITVLLSKPAS